MSEKIKFYTDEHVPTAVVSGLRRRGMDVLTVKEANIGDIIRGLLLMNQVLDVNEMLDHIEFL